MPKLKGLSTADLELRAYRLANSPSAQDIQDARDALLWCARVISAADEVVRAEAMILANARKIRMGENQKAPPPLCRGVAGLSPNPKTKDRTVAVGASYPSPD